MRGSWSIVALVLAVSGVACHHPSKRIMRPTSEQAYALPDANDKKFDDVPEYPKEAVAPLGQPKSTTPAIMGGKGLGGGGGGGGSPGGAPGGSGGFSGRQ